MSLLGRGLCRVLLLFGCSLKGPSPVAQTVKSLPAVQEARVQSLGWEDPPEKGMATQSSFLAWESSRTEEPGRLQSMGQSRTRLSDQRLQFSCFYSPSPQQEVRGLWLWWGCYRSFLSLFCLMVAGVTPSPPTLGASQLYS